MAKGRGRLRQAQKAAKQQQQKQQQHRYKKQKMDSGDGNRSTGNNSSSIKKPPPQPKRHLEPVIPFSPTDPILLVGEGDLSFAASLVSHHACTAVTATVLEPDRAALLTKYPHAEPNIAAVEAAAPGCRVLYGVDARRMAPLTVRARLDGHDGSNGNSDSSKEKVGAMKRILFNFPHVGGRSTDVNRQVRANQELLVDFFRRALPSLSPGGSIVVTLFEGEPYTLWNVRDLARHAGGLAVLRSFRFRADAYPGYRHARTLGVVRRRKDGQVSETGWRGEQRPARSYVFVRKEDAPAPGPVGGDKRRRAGESESESESDSESEADDGVFYESWDDHDGGEGEDEDEDEGDEGDDGED